MSYGTDKHPSLTTLVLVYFRPAAAHPSSSAQPLVFSRELSYDRAGVAFHVLDAGSRGFCFSLRVMGLNLEPGHEKKTAEAQADTTRRYSRCLKVMAAIPAISATILY